MWMTICRDYEAVIKLSHKLQAKFPNAREIQLAGVEVLAGLFPSVILLLHVSIAHF